MIFKPSLLDLSFSNAGSRSSAVIAPFDMSEGARSFISDSGAIVLEQRQVKRGRRDSFFVGHIQEYYMYEAELRGGLSHSYDDGYLQDGQGRLVIPGMRDVLNYRLADRGKTLILNNYRARESFNRIDLAEPVFENRKLLDWIRKTVFIKYQPESIAEKIDSCKQSYRLHQVRPCNKGILILLSAMGPTKWGKEGYKVFLIDKDKQIFPVKIKAGPYGSLGNDSEMIFDLPLGFYHSGVTSEEVFCFHPHYWDELTGVKALLAGLDAFQDITEAESFNDLARALGIDLGPELPDLRLVAS